MKRAILAITVLFAGLLYCNTARAEVRITSQTEGMIEFSYFVRGQEEPRAVYVWYASGERFLDVYSTRSPDSHVSIATDTDGRVDHITDDGGMHFCFERQSRRACASARQIFRAWTSRMQIARRLRQALRSPISNPRQFMP